MGYVAVKALNLCGHKYLPGEHILDEHILPERRRRLVNNNSIAEVHDTDAAIVATGIADVANFDGKIVVPVFQDSAADADAAEVYSIPLTEGDVQNVFSIMQMNAENAAKAIEETESEDVLIVLHACDSRQTVKRAAKKQAEKLAGNREAEQPEG